MAIFPPETLSINRAALEDANGVVIDANHPCEVSVNYHVVVPDLAGWARIYILMSTDNGGSWIEADQFQFRRIGGGGSGSYEAEVSVRCMAPPNALVRTYVDIAGSGNVSALNWVRKQRLA